MKTYLEATDVIHTLFPGSLAFNNAVTDLENLLIFIMMT